MKLSLGFKGQRNYIQGGDIFNSLSDLAPHLTGDPDASIASLAFRTFARSGCFVVGERPSPDVKLIAQAQLAYHDPHDPDHLKTRDVWVVEGQEVITDRRAFDEEALLAPSVTDRDAMSCKLPQRSVYTPIEDLIALTKHLHYALFPDINGKWLFAQIDLTHPLRETYKQSEIILKKCVAGRFSVSEIVIDGQTIGMMRFIVGNP